jgi:glycosyltransferase involved in cell wall biosynthesis
MIIESVPETIRGAIFLKILIINYEFPPLGGGGGVATMDLALEWVKTSQVDVLTSWFKGLPYYEKVNGINVYRVPVFFRKSRDAASFLSMLSYLPFGFFRGLRLCMKNRYDVINTHFAVPSGPLGYALGLIFGIPNVLSLHGGDIYDPSKRMSPHRSFFWRNVVRFIMNRADRIVAQSSNTRDNALRYYRPRKEVGIVPLAFHPPELSGAVRAQLGFKNNEFILITIGRLIKRKAIDHMIRALAAVPDRRLRLLVLGDGPERGYLESLAGELGVNGRVVFTGYVTERQKFDYIGISNVFISTSLHEGFGIVFMEAMHCGLPIICSNHGGQVDFLKNGENALLVEVGDIDGYARSIKRFIDDDRLYRKCSKNNRLRLKEFYAENVAARYTDIFKEVASGRG